MSNKEELEYFQNKLKETMGKGIPKKYLETTELGDIDKEYEHTFIQSVEKHLTECEKIKNILDDSKK